MACCSSQGAAGGPVVPAAQSSAGQLPQPAARAAAGWCLRTAAARRPGPAPRRPAASKLQARCRAAAAAASSPACTAPLGRPPGAGQASCCRHAAIAPPGACPAAGAAFDGCWTGCRAPGPARARRERAASRCLRGGPMQRPHRPARTSSVQTTVQREDERGLRGWLEGPGSAWHRTPVMAECVGAFQGWRCFPPHAHAAHWSIGSSAHRLDGREGADRCALLKQSPGRCLVHDAVTRCSTDQQAMQRGESRCQQPRD